MNLIPILLPNDILESVSAIPPNLTVEADNTFLLEVNLYNASKLFLNVSTFNV